MRTRVWTCSLCFLTCILRTPHFFIPPCKYSRPIPEGCAPLNVIKACVVHSKMWQGATRVCLVNLLFGHTHTPTFSIKNDKGKKRTLHLCVCVFLSLYIPFIPFFYRDVTFKEKLFVCSCVRISVYYLTVFQGKGNPVP